MNQQKIYLVYEGSHDEQVPDSDCDWSYRLLRGASTCKQDAQKWIENRIALITKVLSKGDRFVLEHTNDLWTLNIIEKMCYAECSGLCQECDALRDNEAIVSKLKSLGVVLASYEMYWEIEETILL